MSAEILADIKIPEALQLDISELPRGVNNYHIDVKLSDNFCTDTRKLVKALIHQQGSMQLEKIKHDTQANLLQRSYADMMSVLIHRVKTDLKVGDINFLQFAVPCYVLKTVKHSLDAFIDEKKQLAADLRKLQSSKVLGAQEHIAWLKKNYNSILYAVNKYLFMILKRAEGKHLTPVRKQFLNASSVDYTDLLFNPMLLNRDINSPRFLIEQYQFWSGRGGESEFGILNTEVEQLFEKSLPSLEILPLKTEETDSNLEAEIFDEYGALASSSKFLGPAIDTKNIIHEEFCWLDSLENMQTLFNLDELEDKLSNIKQEQGLKAGWSYNGQIKQYKKIHNTVKKFISSRGLLKKFVASDKTQRLLTQEYSTQVEAKILYQYLCGLIPDNKLQNKIFSGKVFTEEELEPLRVLAKEVIKETKTEADAYVTKTLVNLSRYRLHLKHLRFAHRAFNRINILEEEEGLRLSKQAGTLFELPCADEIEVNDDKIVHHTILKADVRGSTTVTEELEKKELNPASYFSMRFFSPINKVLPVFGANKVFIEGDAIILSFLEHEYDPQQWLGVARSCGIAKAMLSIIHANNKHSTEMELPPLEVGIGICYSDDSPRFLYDGDTPIMISSAIGLADRLSSCSWKLRELMNSDLYNVEVFNIADDSSEKGQEQIRYNVNGILLENEAFAKLQTEVDLKQATVTVNGDEEVKLYYGQYKDLEDHSRTIVVRQGKVGQWKDGIKTYDESSNEVYYEVVTNPKITSLIQGQGQGQVD